MLEVDEREAEEPFTLPRIRFEGAELGVEDLELSDAGVTPR